MSSRSKSKKQKLVITKRDRELFRFLGEHETATFDQIRQKFWPNSVTKQTAQDRLDKLRRDGLIQKFDYLPNDSSQKKLVRYQIKRAALQYLDAETASRLYTKPLQDHEVPQVIATVQARLELERQGYDVQGWISERELRREQHQDIANSQSYDTIADGQVIVIDPSTGEVTRVDVEIDGQYYGKMLKKKLDCFSGREVIWATTPNRISYISKKVNQNIKVIAI